MSHFWLAVRAPDIEPVDLLRLAGAEAEGRCYYGSREGWEIAGVGEAEVLVSRGEGRFSELAAAVDEAVSQLSFVGESGMDHRWLPQFVGGFAFSTDWQPDAGSPWAGFEATRLVLPRLTMVRRNGDARLVLVARAGLDEAAARRVLAAQLEAVKAELGALVARRSTVLAADLLRAPGTAAWDPAGVYEQRVGRALADIAEGALTKVTVARAEAWAPGETLDPADVLVDLARRYPRCFRFCIQPAGGPAFVGASPERLIKVEDRVVRADALAGTAARASGVDADRALGDELFACEKERREHQAVVGYLHDRLAAVVPDIEAASEPGILKLAHVQHLHTPFRGQLSERDAGAAVIELASRVHPTPAVAGVPTERALRWLREHEGLDRGWYAGGVGTVAPRGEGEFCVAIRSALIAEGQVVLFAGAGIVQGSEPSRERAETDQKLRGLREVLLGRGNPQERGRARREDSGSPRRDESAARPHA